MEIAKMYGAAWMFAAAVFLKTYVTNSFNQVNSIVIAATILMLILFGVFGALPILTRERRLRKSVEQPNSAKTAVPVLAEIN